MLVVDSKEHKARSPVSVHDLSPISLPVERRSGIYAFQHKVKGKIYVGQSKNLITRRRQHESGTSKNSRRFHNALAHHGPEAFNFFVLEYCEIAALDEREAYWIDKLSSLHPAGYNLKSGGGAIHGHHPETKEVMSRKQKARVEAGEHPFASSEFQRSQAERQRRAVELGLHPSQDPIVRAKRNVTVRKRIESDGKFFTHSPERIDLFREKQQKLYAAGQGKFQQAELITSNQARVQKRLAEGSHFSQKPGWSDQARSAASKQMKCVCLAVRHVDGSTSTYTFESLHSAEAKLGVDRTHLSGMCSGRSNYKYLVCKLGLVIKVCYGNKPNWVCEELAQIPTINFLSTKPVLVTIELADGSTTQRSFLSQRAACDRLEAHHRAFRWIIKGEKYKSTGCNLGRIVGVSEIDPLPEHIEELIASSNATD
jgi:group I intron endonuclease